MQDRAIDVRIDWDDEALVWVATSEDIDGLVVEAATVRILVEKVKGAIEDLAELNDWDTDLAEAAIRFRPLIF